MARSASLDSETVVGTGGDSFASDLPSTVVTGVSSTRRSERGQARTSGPNWGRYVLIEEIGRGGMGVVVRAYDPRLQREVALKALHAELLTSDMRARMLREAQSMAKLSHPNVVAIYDVELAGSDVVIAMEYVTGTTLQKWIAQKHSWRDIVSMYIAAGRGLAAAHGVGLLHRDFKPANVLVGADGRARVTDFGLARSHGHPRSEQPETSCEDGERGSSDNEITMVGTVLGTPRYMAPEQHDGGVLGPAADQYAFCVALWEALVGRSPFNGHGLHSAAEEKRGGAPPWPHEVVVPAAIAAALRRGLAVRPQDRWATMDELIDVLASTLEERSGQRRWERALTGTAVAAVIAAGLAWTNYSDGASDRCTGASEQLNSVWDDGQREVVHSAIVATGLSYAEDVWQRLAPRLDGYASTWASMHTSACEATSVHGEQSAEVLDLRMACLHRAKVGLRAATGLLANADPQVVEKAHQIVAGLPDLERCADVEALQAEVAPPPAAHREAVDAIRDELAQVKALREAGKYPEILARMPEVAERARAIPYVPLQTEALVELGMAWEHSGAYPRAEAAFSEALRSALASKQWDAAAAISSYLVYIVGELQTKPTAALAYGETAQGLLGLAEGYTEALLRSAIARALQALGRYGEAEHEHRAALSIAERLRGPDDLDVATLRRNLGTNLAVQGRLEESEQEQRAALAIRLRALGPRHPDVAFARLAVAQTLHLHGRYEEAESELLAAAQAYDEALGRKHASTVMARAMWADAVAAQGRHEEAAAAYREVLQLQRDIYGPDHVEVSATHGSLGVSLTHLGQYEEAEMHLRRAVAIDEKTFDSDHPDAAITRIHLAELLIHQGRHREAEALARLAVATFESFEHQHSMGPFAHSSLGAALNAQKRHREAEMSYQTALQLAEKIFGPQHPGIGRLLTGLGTALEGQGRHDEAATQLRKAVTVLTDALGPGHSDVALAHGLLGHALLVRGRYAEAEAEYRDALASYQAASGSDHPGIARLQAGLAQVLVERGQIPQALAVLERAWAKWQDDERVEIPVKARLALDLVHALWETGAQRGRAREIARSALASWTSSKQASDQQVDALEAWLRRHG